MKKNIMRIFMGIMAMLMFTGCFVDIDPGYVGVRAWKRGTMAGEIEILNPGRHSFALRATDVKFPTFKQNYVWTANSAEGSRNDESITFTIEGLNTTIDVGVEFSVVAEYAGVIYSEYLASLDTITDGAMRNFVRDAIMDKASSYNNMETFISDSLINEMMNEVEVATKEYFIEKGINVTNIYLAGAPTYPPTIVRSIEAKIEATQAAIQRENELRSSEAQAAMDEAEAIGQANARVASAEGDARALLVSAQSEANALLVTADAEARANRLVAQSLTQAILQSQWINKWNGKLPETSLGAESGVMLDLN